MAMVDVHVVS